MTVHYDTGTEMGCLLAFISIVLVLLAFAIVIKVVIETA